VELIVATSISAIVLLSGYELFQALRGVSDRQNEDMAAIAETVHGLEGMREDLLHALSRGQSHEPVFVGDNPSLDGAAETTMLLEFCSLCTDSRDNQSYNLRQIQRIRYELIKVPDSFRLCRSATPVVRPGRMGENRSREQVLDHVEQVRIAFHNGRTLESHFSSNEELPVGVDIVVTTHGQAWPLSVRLPCGPAGGQP